MGGRSFLTWWSLIMKKVDIQYTVKLHSILNDLPFLPERIKIEKVEKLVVKLHDKSE